MGVHVSSGVTIVLLAVGLVAASDRRQVEQRKALRHGQLSGFIYSDSWLFQHDMVSRIRCAGLCLLDKSCRTFTFTAIAARRGVCRGHSALMTSQSPKTFSDETAFYIIRDHTAWLDTPCSVEGGSCSAVNSACYRGKCRCTPGYYYSLRLNLCIDYCRQSDLQASVRSYERARIKGHNTYIYFGSTHHCQQVCFQHPHCRTLERKASTDACHLSNYTALDVPQYWDPNRPEWHFFQRDCA